jgi:hypothetical protein
MNGEISRNQLVELLRTLIEGKKTGTLYVRTDDNHLILIGLNSGDVVSLICGPKQGERAIPLIRSMRNGTYRLEEGATHHRRLGAQLPSSEALLAMLAEGADGHTSEHSTDWGQGALCKILANYLGPIAPLVCSEAISAAGGIESGEKLRRVIDNLALEIEDAAEAERFRGEAQQALKDLLD